MLNNLSLQVANESNEEHLQVITTHMRSPLIRKYHGRTFTSSQTPESLIQPAPYTVYIIYRENTAVGLCGITKEYNEHTVMIFYTVLPKYQGQNIGSQIPNLMINLIKKQLPKVTTIYAYVYKNNNASIRIMEKNNFTRIHKVDDSIAQIEPEIWTINI